jgi:hypothetical protein
VALVVVHLRRLRGGGETPADGEAADDGSEETPTDAAAIDAAAGN